MAPLTVRVAQNFQTRSVRNPVILISALPCSVSVESGFPFAQQLKQGELPLRSSSLLPPPNWPMRLKLTRRGFFAPVGISAPMTGRFVPPFTFHPPPPPKV